MQCAAGRAARPGASSLPALCLLQAALNGDCSSHSGSPVGSMLPVTPILLGSDPCTLAIPLTELRSAAVWRKLLVQAYDAGSQDF